MVRLVAFLLALCTVPATAQPVRIGPGEVGPPGSGAPHVLHLPRGEGPHPAVVLLHGCSGITPTVRRWAAQLAGWGYAALVLDSFGPRGVRNVCREAGGSAPRDGVNVSPRERAEDAFAAAAFLRSRSDVRPDGVSAVGFSHGGSTALVVASRTAAERNGAAPFAAVVAFYPWCPRTGAPLASPLLVLTGDADDWTPADRCQALRAAWRPEFGLYLLQVYPGVTHAFDSRGTGRVYFGHVIRPDPAATEDAALRLRRFLDAPG
ncbi:dienelactone hydrolase family protein [Roseomonas sp. CCTCC AB2023176]|uniref:dienelactone hydrolase family protein n=1 Tax=Roseomonas sp. CCTCC AB2023176 TaxID=3342640 RepID=UPI0035DBE560